MNLAYIVENFPSRSEYFILNEIMELEKSGFSIIVLAVKSEQPFSTKAVHLKERTYYASISDQVFGIFYFFFHHSGRFLATCFNAFLEGSVSMHDFLSGFKSLILSCGFAYRIKATHLDYIHAHFAFLPSKLGVSIARLLKKPYSLSVHAQDIFCNSKLSLRYALLQAKFVITCTEYNRRYLTGLFPDMTKKIHHVYHGIDINQWPHYTNRMVASEEIKLLSVGRFVEKKGIIYILEAVKFLLEQHINVQCRIIGSGPLEAQFRNFVRDHGLIDHIHSIAAVQQTELVRYYREADIFILPCVQTGSNNMDGLPNVLLEALASGLPVITTPLSAIPELIVHKHTGYFVSPKNPREIALAVNELVRSPDLYHKLSIEGRKTIEDHFLIQNSTQKLVSLFTSCHEEN